MIRCFKANKSRSVFGKKKTKVVKTIGLQRGETKRVENFTGPLDHSENINWYFNMSPPGGSKVP